ncbi:hypothetical protein IJT10_06285 [bacterium]|nr:hypothetical protein [bacterium]
MKCQNCNHEIADSALTCSYCGKLVAVDSREANEIFADTASEMAQASNNVIGNLAATGEEAIQELRDLSQTSGISQITASQISPIRDMFRQLNELSSDAKTPDEKLLLKSNVLYGANSNYMQNASIELTNKRILFYENVSTRSGLVNFFSAFMSRSFSFDIKLEQIENMERCEVNYNPGHKIYLINKRHFIIQCSKYAQFDRLLRQLLDNPNRQPD